MLAETDYDGAEKCYYTRGADLISQERDGKTYTYLYDGHGSVVGLMSESGSVTDTYTYDAFGNLLKSTGRTANNYRYCGEQFDSTTGLYYLRARYMDTSTGRFITQDSYAGNVYDPVSLHKYLYANSNPVMYIDPSGYMGLLAETIVSVSIDTICCGILPGIINVGFSLIKALKGANATGGTVNFGYVIAMSFTEGFLTGAFFGACGMLAASLSSAAIYYALGGSSVLFALMSFGAAYAEGKAGNEDLAMVYFLFGMLEVSIAKNCFDNAAAITSAKATAGSTTNPSTDNKNTLSDADDGWKHWNDYEHIEVGDKTYAKINGRNYSQHAVDRMQPSGRKYKLGGNIYQAGGVDGRGVSPHVVEYIIGTSVPSVQNNGNIAYTNGTVTVITNSNGDVVTILTK